MDFPVSSVDARSVQRPHFVLCHYDAAGAVNRERILAYPHDRSITTYHLINDTTTETCSTAQEIDSFSELSARIELHDTHAALSVFQEVNGGSWILPSERNEAPFRIPVSSESSKILVLLRHGDNFTTSSGRWSVTLMGGSSMQDNTDLDTKLKQSESSPTSVKSLPASMSTNSDNVKHGPLQELHPKKAFSVLERRHSTNMDAKMLKSVEQSMNIDVRLGKIPEGILDTSNLLPLQTIQSVTATQENHPSPNSATMANTDPLDDCLLPIPDARQGDEHLKETSLNITSEGDGQQHHISISNEPRRSIFGQQMTEPTAGEGMSHGEPKTSPPLSLDKKGSTANIAAFAGCSDEDKKNSSQRINMNRPTMRKRKQRTYATVHSISPNDQVNGDCLSDSLDEDSDTIQVTLRPVQFIDGESPQKSNASASQATRKSKKLSANTSPASSTRLSARMEPLPSLPNSAGSFPASIRGSKVKAYSGPVLKVFFSSSTFVDSNDEIMESFKQFGCSMVKSIKKADVLCVSSGTLKKTTNFVTAVALGKHVIDEVWLVESHEKRTLLDPEAFITQDTKHEHEWNFDLKAAIARGKAGLSDILDATSVYFTRQLKTDLGANFKDFCKIAVILGADNMGVNLPTQPSEDETVIFIGVENDAQAPAIRGLGYKLHQKDLLVMSVLRGRIDLASDEFVIEAPVKSEADD